MTIHEDLGEFHLSYSSLSLSCWRKFEFQKIYPPAPRGKGSLSGDVGKALHEGYQDFKVFGDEDRAIAKMMLAYPIDLNDDPSNYRSLEACYATLQAMIHSDFMDAYKIVQIDCLDGQQRPAIEVPFKIKLKDTYLDAACKYQVCYIGYIDFILFALLKQEYCTVDLKTTRDKRYDPSVKYQFSQQVMPYELVLQHMLGAKIADMENKYMHVYVDVLEPKVSMYNFPQSNDMLEDWVSGLIIDIRQIQEFYKADWWPRNGNSCSAFFGKCSHFDYCSSRNKESIKTYRGQQEKDVVPVKEFLPWIEFELDMSL